MIKKMPLICLAVTLLVGCGGSKPGGLRPAPMPAGGNFSGVYQSPQYGEINLMTTGNSVVGDYKKDERSGRITGTAEGDLMTFEWVEYRTLVAGKPLETRGKGYFRYVIDPSSGEHMLKGEWGLGDDYSGGGPWEAWKSKRQPPRFSGGSKNAEGGE